MSVLELDGDSARLREAAKAYADGTLSRDDYRHYRAKIIESLSNGEGQSEADEPLEEYLFAGDSPMRLLVIVGLATLVVFASFVAYLIYVG
ncbi:MAG: hypothetical protein O7G84_18890 [Gammaproteobacteria bacterium]|nr:hypothetical protein [Gammaproteobacteria bacterium]